MEHRVLLGNAVLNLADQQHISVIVLFQKLKGQTLLDLTAEDRQNHILSFLLVLVKSFGGLNLVNDSCRVHLLLLVNKIERDLVPSKEVITEQKLLQEDGSALGQVEVEMALSNLEEVKVRPVVSLVDQEDHPQHFSFEFLVANGVVRNREGVAQKVLPLVRALDSLLNGIDTSCGHCDSNDMLVVAFAIALLELLVDDVFHAAVNLNRLIIVVDDSHTLLDVQVNALVDEGLRVEVVIEGDVEAVSSFERESQSFIVLLKVVEDLGGNSGSELLFGEGLLVHEGLDAGQLVRDFGPLVVDDLCDLAKSVDLFFLDAV